MRSCDLIPYPMGFSTAIEVYYCSSTRLQVGSIPVHRLCTVIHGGTRYRDIKIQHEQLQVPQTPPTPSPVYLQRYSASIFHAIDFPLQKVEAKNPFLENNPYRHQPLSVGHV